MPPLDNDSAVLETPAAAPPPQPAEAPSLRETLEKAIESNPIDAPASDRETREQTESRPSVSRERDPFGRFAKRAPDGSEVPSQEEVRVASEPVTQEEPDHEETQPAESPSLDRAPKSWKAGPRDKWATLDPDIRAEVHRRERESGRAIAEAGPIKKFAQSFQEVIQPHAERYRGSGLQPLQVVANLMQADHYLASAPMPDRARFMAKLISDYKIDIQALDAALSGGDPASEPMSRVEQLISEKLAPIQGFVQTEQQRRQQMVQYEQDRAQTGIEAMAQDNATYPHFDLVVQDMADIMEMNAKRKIYISPQEAYKRAVAMNPDAQAAEQGRAGQQRAQSAHDAATRSLGASLSVSGSPAGLKQKVEPSDLRGTIEAAWEAAQGR
jgi:hypothetical protein